MTFENTSIFTTIGWDGDRKFFAIEEHLDRLEIYANKTGKTFDDKVKLNIKKKLKNHVFSNINEKSIDNLCKPPGLVKIKLNSDGDIFISDRSNKKNRKCKFVKAITIEAPANLKMNKGIKIGNHDAYVKAYNIAKKHNGNVALLVDKDAIIDGDRATLMVLDKDGTAWVSSEEYGAISSITVELIKNKLLDKGIPISYGKITTDLILRCEDAIMLGTGLGITQISTIDERVFNFPKSILFDAALSSLNEVMNVKWTEIKMG
tara:strand:- start:128 stop:913 length:786 start_codon:yes stop_codon:yes gene_type:complete